MDFQIWQYFFITTLVVSLSPGPGAIAAMGVGLNHGFRRGQVVAFGLALGVWTQLLVVGVGLGALLATSETAFSVIKWIGAAYLVWLGIQQWRSPASPITEEQAAGNQAATADPVHLRRSLFLRGWMVNALNPKGTVFLLAVMPQFIVPDQALAPQYLTIAATFGVVECCVMTGYVALASKVLGLLREPNQIRWMNRSFGSLFIAAGLFLASFKRAA